MPSMSHLLTWTASQLLHKGRTISTVAVAAYMAVDKWTVQCIRHATAGVTPPIDGGHPCERLTATTEQGLLAQNV